MYATFTGPTFTAVVDSDDRTRWALFSGDSPTAREWAAWLNDGTRGKFGLHWSDMSEHEYRADLSPVSEDRTAQGTALATMRRREAELTAEVDRLRADNRGQAERIVRLSTEQVRADDPRLSEFWEDAHSAADDAGHCEVFDRLCEELGGPSRDVEVDVTVSYTFTTTISRSDYANGDYSDIDPSDYVDLSNFDDMSVSRA